jgi:hypothetical protein
MTALRETGGVGRTIARRILLPPSGGGWSTVKSVSRLVATMSKKSKEDTFLNLNLFQVFLPCAFDSNHTLHLNLTLQQQCSNIEQF